MPIKYNTSVNIIRDADRELNYIPTPNTIQVAHQISNDFKKGLRAFTLIGSYGTGKSSFIWALQQELNKNGQFFKFKLLNQPSVGIINLIGDYTSVKSALEQHFSLGEVSEKHIFSELFNAYHDLGKRDPLLIVFIDEFGKFLEYAAAHNPEKELYFIQQLVEFFNNPDHNIILVTTVHQNIDAYAYALNPSQKQEWTKVKGRFREITFNEPVEQLLYLAASHLEAKRIGKAPFKKIILAVELFIKSKAFNVNHQYIEEIADKIFPLDLFAGNVLTLALQRYAQNERSLFSFLESTDQTSINFNTTDTSSFYHIGHVYDYLVYNFYSFINSQYNRDLSSWRSIQSSLEAVERKFAGDQTSYARLVQTIGLLNIFAANGAVLDKAALVYYAANCMDIKNAEELISELETKKIILYRNYSQRYILFEGTDLDIQLALFEAGNKVEQVVDVTGLINKYYQLPSIIAKEVSYNSGTPRLFEYVISEEPKKNLVPKGEVDGYINLIFNESLKESDVIDFSRGQQEAVIYGYYKNSKGIKDLLFEIEKTKKVIEENVDDKIAVKELTNIILHQQNLLNHRILNNFYNSKKEVVWIYRGAVVQIRDKKSFNKRLSRIVNDVYDRCPVFKNELVNKNKISPSIHTARRNFIRALVNFWDRPQLNFPKDKFPPEKTIYLTLLENNGISLFSTDFKHEIAVHADNSFYPLWQFSLQFMESTKVSKRCIKDLHELLAIRPFKLKQGLIDLWIVSFLFIKRNDFSLFHKGSYVATINDEILELMIKGPEDFEIKAFDIGGVKLDLFNSYRMMLQQTTKEHLTNQDFVDTIKPFLTFYKGLPDYSKNTRRLSPEALNIREAIIKAKDPEQTFFEAFPNALNYSVQALQNSPLQLQQYVNLLQGAIKELRNSYTELVTRVDMFLQTDILGEEAPYPEYKLALQTRYKRIRKHLLLQKQRVIIQRINSELEDRNAWLNSIVQAVTGLTLEKFTDDSELVLYDKFKFAILELDSLTNMSKADFSDDKEDLINVEISTFADGMKSQMIRLPKNKAQQVEDAEDDLRHTLTKDRTVNIAALTKLLKELLNEE
jgi:hypothetical protein